LSDIKFDYPEAQTTQPTQNVDPFSAEIKDPVIENEGPGTTSEPPRDESDPWAKKELFNLNNIAKAPKKNLGLSTQNSAPQSNVGAIGGQFGSNNFGISAQPQTAEQRMNALENAFGSSADAQQPAQTMQQPAPQANNFGAAQPQTKSDDFGEFPSMFSGNNDGFGNFEGFGNDAFSSNMNDDFGSKPAPTQNTTQNTQPAGQKKDDWFEF
jgi:hypothetical protein